MQLQAANITNRERKEMIKNLSEKPIAEVQKEQAEKWNQEDLLGKCVSTREGQPKFIFYEGPPTANGKPGIHHMMARSLKDSVNPEMSTM